MADKVLVSGANGFIAAHAVERLLSAGHQVVGTVRDPENRDKTAHLRAMDGAGERLSLVAADLTDADPFTAHADVDVVLHMASPFVVTVDDPQRDLVDPAVEGTLSMMRAAAANPRVRRVVLTSSVAAITDEPEGRPVTEADWNVKSSLDRNPYYYSKTLAERAAWDFMEREKPGFDLVVVNPFMVLGPAHSKAVGTSNQIIVDMMTGKFPMIMALNFGIVDVRDVADAHIRAMDPAVPTGRYICAAANIDMADIVRLMKAEGYGHAKLPKFNMTGPVGTAVARLAALTQPKGVRTYLKTNLGKVPGFDNSKIKRDMGITFRTPEDALRDTFADLSRWGHVPKPKASESPPTSL